MSEFASKEERYFQWYLDELIDAGYVRSFKYQPKPFKLFKGATVTWLEVKKTKTKERIQPLLSGHTYQADFIIYWNESAELIFYGGFDSVLNTSLKKFPFIANHDENLGYYTVLDVKGNYNQNDAWRRFSIDQKWVFLTYSIYVQKVIPVPSGKDKFTPATALFMKTFMPKRYKRTDEDKQDRVIHFPHNSLQEYVAGYRN